MAGRSRVAEGPTPLPTVMGQLAERRSLLDKADDTIAETIKGVEAVLQHHVPTRIVHVIEFDAKSQDFEQLAFTKLSGKWCLALETGYVDPSDGSDVIRERAPLSSCSREKRAAMFASKAVEELIRKSVTQIDAQLAAREVALVNARELLAMLKPSSPPASDVGGSDKDIPF